LCKSPARAGSTKQAIHAGSTGTILQAFTKGKLYALIAGCGVEAASVRKRKAKLNYRRIVLRLPDLDHFKTAVLNSLASPGSRRVYQFAINQFITWYAPNHAWVQPWSCAIACI
jgi:hypothetical protein